MKAVCVSGSLSLVDADLRKPYAGYVSPLDYDFGLVAGCEYLLLALIVRGGGGAWFYVTPPTEVDVSIVPAVLFSADWQRLYGGWKVKADESGVIQLAPEKLAAIDGWYEKYIEGDDSVISFIRSLLLSK